MTAHVFGEQAVSELVAAGIDGIEHGTGIDDATIVLMAEHQVALVPTMIQLDNFEMYAQSGEDRFPAYARHMRALYASRLERFGKALDAGVPIYAGTDAGGFFRMAWSVRRLRRWDSSARLEYALGAGSWRARAWLGHPSRLSEGAQADLVVFDADPRLDSAVLRAPLHVILRGALIA